MYKKSITILGIIADVITVYLFLKPKINTDTVMVQEYIPMNYVWLFLSIIITLILVGVHVYDRLQRKNEALRLDIELTNEIIVMYSVIDTRKSDYLYRCFASNTMLQPPVSWLTEEEKRLQNKLAEKITHNAVKKL